LPKILSFASAMEKRVLSGAVWGGSSPFRIRDAKVCPAVLTVLDQFQYYAAQAGQGRSATQLIIQPLNTHAHRLGEPP